jgi:HK97 family phage major capsid protein
MQTSYVSNLRAKWQNVRESMEAITERAAKENRDLNDVELANFKALREELEALTPRIEQMHEVQRSINTTAGLFSEMPHDGITKLNQAQGALARQSFQSPGHYLNDLLRSRPGTMEYDPDARARVQRAIEDITTGDITGIVPEPILGSVWEGIDRRRPLVGSFTLRTISSPLMFRPKVVQHTKVGPQGTAGKIGSRLNTTDDEKKELVSRELKLGRVNIEPTAIGGVVDISLWAEMFSPDLLNIVIADLAGEYAIQSEAIAAAELTRAATASAVAAIATLDGKSVQKALYDAAAKVYNTIGMLPGAVAMSTDVWAAMGAFVDGSDRPLYPAIAPQNASATQSADTFSNGPLEGLRRIVSPGLPAKSLIVFDSASMEFFERRLGVLQVLEPEKVGRLVSYSGLVACIAMDDGAAVKIPLP